MRGWRPLSLSTPLLRSAGNCESEAVTEPMTVALDELRAAAADLHAIAIRLRADVAAFEYASIADGWATATATRRCGSTVAGRLTAVIRDLEQDRAALDEAAAAYVGADDRAIRRMSGAAARSW
jgi:hypothetical protein